MARLKKAIPVYFASLEIENVRCFGDTQRLNLTTENGRPARWTLILGDNGVGKTTLLQCLAWMHVVPEPTGDSDSTPLEENLVGTALQDEENEILNSLLRVGSGSKLSLGAKLSVGGTLASGAKKPTAGSQPKVIGVGVEVLFDQKGRLSNLLPKGPRLTIKNAFGGEFPDPLVVAYGANRQLGERNLNTGDVEDPIAFSRLPGVTELYDVEEILSGLDYASKKKDKESTDRLKRLKVVLTKILPESKLDPSHIRIFPPDLLDRGEPSGAYLKTFSGMVRMSALSLGYQTTLAWTTDLAWRLLKRYPRSPAPLHEPAVVLIDEIDLHLHPLWQLRIIDDLSAIFRGTQFIATAHSPLMVQVAETANLVLLRRRETDVDIVNDPEVVKNWRVDQILTSELFSVPRSRNAQTEQLFIRRDELLDKVRSKAEERELERLRVQISKLPTAQDPDDQQAMDFIREAAALLKQNKGAGR